MTTILQRSALTQTVLGGLTRPLFLLQVFLTFI